MGIRFSCTHCGHVLNIKTHLAGKRAFCPKCEGRLTIPDKSTVVSSEDDSPNLDEVAEAISVAPSLPKAASSSTKVQGKGAMVTEAPGSKVDSFTLDQPQNSESSEQSEFVDALDEAPDAVWYVRPPSGGQFGPASKELMRRWLNEGRVTKDSHVWREGWPDWRQATNAFPHVFGAPKKDADEPVKSGNLSRSLASQKLYIKRKRRRNTIGITVILFGILIIIALSIVLVIVLQSN